MLEFVPSTMTCAGAEAPLRRLFGEAGLDDDRDRGVRPVDRLADVRRCPRRFDDLEAAAAAKREISSRLSWL